MSNKITTKIISLGSAVPEKSYTQEEIFNSLKYPKAFWPIFRDSGIEKRHMWIPLGTKLSWQEACEQYKIAAMSLSLEAAKQCLMGYDIKDIGCIVFGSCTGYQCPSMNYLIAKELNLPRDIEHIPVVGDGGCAGSAPDIRLAVNYVKCHQDKLALAISCEICSVCGFPENPNPDPTNKYQLLRANAIFADGASAVLIGNENSNNIKHPVVIDSETFTDYEHQDALGFTWKDGRLMCVLGPEVPSLTGISIKHCIDILLDRRSLDIEDIDWILCHPGGAKVLDNVRDSLKLSEDKMFLSREGLRNYGNCSSASVGMLSKLTINSGALLPKSGDFGLILTVGSGMNANAILLKFGE